MLQQPQIDILNFFVAGINYKKTDATRRSLFAIGEEQYEGILNDAKACGLTDLFVLSTCNRTEMYGFADNAEQLLQLLCRHTEGSLEAFREIAYIKNGNEAMQHLFEVGAGLDSQILGDYEIVGQIKKAIKFSKEHQCLGGYMERLTNSVLQSSKEIKTTTELSGGTVSVSFAAVQYIKEKVSHIAEKKIALIGVGKIGSNTSKNLVDYLDTKNIVLVNRTAEKAAELASALGIEYAPIDSLDDIIAKSDIILVATNCAKPVITKEQLIGLGPKLIFDLSIPNNVDPRAQELDQVHLINVDELSKIKDSTFLKRQAEIPKALDIISKHSREFLDWHQLRRNVPVIKAIKTKLEQLHHCDIFIGYYTRNSKVPVQKNEEKIKKVINGLAVKMKAQDQRGCYYLEALNEFIAIA